ncbi:tight adherence protein C [Sphingomonas vulcanisoli]|uniref:Tight adherence protein C n=1 Tax=Sphingomonas vulcanisoli TaxID=1658060 RepID=A0ABX0TTS5_9SPHN|nr:type II secretion system F family protein [Sphingomonas vulcanisoli]NIJ07001.1 tight adherence protein C [Sphingomonas vulcanisoli]
MGFFTSINMTWIATFMSVAALGSLIVFFWAATTARDPMTRRVKALNARREQLKAGITASTRKRTPLNKKSQSTDRMRKILASLKVLQGTQIREAQIKLAQAGIRTKDTAITVIFGRLVLPVVLGGGVVIAVYGFGCFSDWSWIKRYLLVAGSLIGSYKAPDIYLKNLITKRTAAIHKGIADALDLLVICAEAGLTVDAAFARVARELGKGYPELADEMALTSIELGFLTDRRQAFENLTSRVKLESLRGVVTTMIQTEKYGTPLASALRVLTAEFRHERMMKAEEKAARLPAIMTVPLILFILPVLFIVILGPAACSISDNMFKN